MDICDDGSQLDIWECFSQLWAREVDLLHDMGPSEVFYIDGESLIFEALCMPRSQATTPLSVIWHIECLLKQLQSTGNTVFTLLFFDDYHHAWESAHPAQSALRALVIRHLTSIGIQILRFDSWQSDLFKNKLQSEKPVFMLVTDVFTTADIKLRSTFSTQHPVAELIVGLVFKTLLWGTDCAYMSSLKFDAVTAYGFLTSAQKSIQVVRSVTISYNSKLTLSPLTSLEQQKTTLAVPTHMLGQLGYQLSLGVSCCASVLNSVQLSGVNKHHYAWLADAWLLHLALMRTMPIDQRALKCIVQPDDVKAPVTAFLQCLLRCVPAALSKLPSSRYSDQPCAEVVDSYDCNLFYHAALAISLVHTRNMNSNGYSTIQAEELGLPAAVLEEWSTARSLLFGFANANTPMGLQQASSECKPVCWFSSNAVQRMGEVLRQPLLTATHQTDMQNTIATASQLLSEGFLADAFAHCGLRQFVDNVKEVHGHHANITSAQIPVEVAPLFTSQQPFEEVYHWHCRKMLDPALLSESRDEVAWIREQQRKLDNIKLDEISGFKGLTNRAKRIVDDKLSRASCAIGEDREALQAEALKFAKDAIRARLERQIQLNQKALERMVQSLQGTSFRAPSSNRLLSQASCQVETKSSKKAEAIRAEQSKIKQSKALAEDVEAWQPVWKAIRKWSEAPSMADVDRKVLEPLEKYISSRKGLLNEMLQVALGTRILVLQLALRQVAKDTERSVASQPDTTALKKRLLTDLIETLQSIRKLPATNLLNPLLASMDVTADRDAGSKKPLNKSKKADTGTVAAQPGPDPCSVLVPHKPKHSTSCVAAVVAVLASLGFNDTASCFASELVKRAYVDSKPITNGTKKKAGRSTSQPVDGVLANVTEEEAFKALLAAADAVPLKAQPLDGVCLTRFQLQHMPHLLERPSHGLTPDARVDGFIPDAWQRRVLDVVDLGSSAVVVAPTSSGKTFISSYVIASVLKSSETGRVAIVLPTKALVNQVRAQVYKDFGTAARLGVFTRDFRENVESCRVLITVPACLEIMILSPTNRDWTEAVQYLVLDEVHCMNERDSGETWERIMHGIRCPLIALSATIGNPQEFTTWLRSVKKLQQLQDTTAGIQGRPATYEVHLIEHLERYNDLQFHVYAPNNIFVNSSTSSKPGNDIQCKLVEKAVARPVTALQEGYTHQHHQDGHLDHLHPLASLRVADIAAGMATATELSLMPSEALQLYDAMVSATSKVCFMSDPDRLLERLTMLEPASSLGPAAMTDGGPSPQPLVSRPAAKKWSAHLLELFDDWAKADNGLATAAEQIVQQFTNQAFDNHKRYETDWLSTTGVLSDSPHGSRVQEKHLMGMLLSLKANGKLPAIVFNFDRSSCEGYAKQLVSELQRSEAYYREKHKEVLEKEGVRREQAQRQAEAEQAKAANKRDTTEQSHVSNAPVMVIDGLTFHVDEDKPSPSFTFLPPTAMTSELLSDTIEELGDLLRDTGNEELGAALARGIGVHHGGLPTRYRQAVEILFRSKVLQVVIATGTLAYGIHMPCKCVVMAGDSVFLDALNFRQMSGRAGRRGLDTLGHVVFFHVPSYRAQRLLAAPLPSLRGQLLMTPTLTLRLALLSQQLLSKPRLNKQHNRHAAEQLLGSIVQESFLRHGSLGKDLASSPGTALNPVQEQLLHTFAMSVRFLMDSGLMNPRGQAVGLAGLATHLFWTEPANFVLVQLLTSGVLYKMVADASEQGRQPRIEMLGLLVAHLFQRKALPRTRAMPMREAASGRSPSIVLLPQLPQAVADVIQKHNAKVLTAVVDGILTYAQAIMRRAAQDPTTSTRMQQEDSTLPLSGIIHTAPNSTAPQSIQHQLQSASPHMQLTFAQAFLHPYSPLKLSAAAASPFACLLGNGDTFHTLSELMACKKQRIFIAPSTIPLLEITDRHGHELPLNAYALDFLKHGQLKALVEWNGMAEGDVWELLRGLQGILTAVALAVELAAEELELHTERQQATEVAKALREVCTEFCDKFSKHNRR